MSPTSTQDTQQTFPVWFRYDPDVTHVPKSSPGSLPWRIQADYDSLRGSVESALGRQCSTEETRKVLGQTYASESVGDFLEKLTEIGFIDSEEARKLSDLARSRQPEGQHDFKMQYQDLIDRFEVHHRDVYNFHSTMKRAMGQAKRMETVANTTLNAYLASASMDADLSEDQHESVLESLQQIGPLLDLHKHRCLPSLHWNTTFGGITGVGDNMEPSTGAGALMEDLRSSTSISKGGALTLDCKKLAAKISQRHGLEDRGSSLLSRAASLIEEECSLRTDRETASEVDMRKALAAWDSLASGNVASMISRSTSLGQDIPLQPAFQEN